MSACLDKATILALARDALATEQRAVVEAHLATCEPCRRQVAWSRELALDATGTPNEVLASSPTEAAGPAPAPVHVGQILAGRYQVERVLGIGGMGVVVAARHVGLDQRVALKFLLPAAYESPGAVARFVREGKAAASITSEHVVRVFDTGVLENGAPYLVMEHLEGADLGHVLEQRGRLEAAEAVEYVLQACEAIAEAHQLGIVHRDLKPANLFLTKRKDGSPLVKVLDFGISKSESGSKRNLTSTSAIMGSPRYMSPEQMLSTKHVDARTDVWALGVILHELVAGAPVWDADTLQGLCVLITTAPAPPLRSLAPAAPEALERAILGCLAKATADRTPDVAALALALAPAAPERALTSVERIVGVTGSRAIPAPRPATPIVRPAAAISAGASPAKSAAAVSVAPAPAWRTRAAPVGAVAAIVLAGAFVVGIRFVQSPPVTASTAPLGATAPPAPTAPTASTAPSAATPERAEPMTAPSAAPTPSVAIENGVSTSRPRARPVAAPRPSPTAPPPVTPSLPEGSATSDRK